MDGKFYFYFIPRLRFCACFLFILSTLLSISPFFDPLFWSVRMYQLMFCSLDPTPCDWLFINGVYLFPKEAEVNSKPRVIFIVCKKYQDSKCTSRPRYRTLFFRDLSCIVDPKACWFLLHLVRIEPSPIEVSPSLCWIAGWSPRPQLRLEVFWMRHFLVVATQTWTYINKANRTLATKTKLRKVTNGKLLLLEHPSFHSSQLHD